MPVIADPGRIHSLPAVLASQIAAGEVIERPASVIKELVENSLDAGADRIRIDVEAAGNRLIRVHDDGCGIHPDDLQLAIGPHSTSKIQRVEDLAAITSLGFRGEALASIAAVARLRICSRHAALSAHEIYAEPGSAVASPAPASHPAGTTIEVRDLFCNMPARRKFLRSEQTEFLHILELVKSLSLSRLDLGLRLTHNGRDVFAIQATSGLMERVGRIFGGAFASQACTVDESDGAMHLHGIAGQVTAARSQADRQYLFLNGRLIRDRRLNHALRTAYHDVMPAGRYAPFLLYLEMDPAAYDINVHPTKHEVRFRDGRDVHDFVFSALRRSLDANRPIGDWPSRPGPVQQRPIAVTEPAAAGYQSPPADIDATLAVTTAEQQPFGCLLGCIMGHYLLTATPESFTVIDGRAVLERLTHMELAQAQPPRGRPLLLPVTLAVRPDQATKAEYWQQTLESLAIGIEPSSPTQIMLRTLPAALPAVDAESLLPVLLDCLMASASADELQRRVIGELATHAGRLFDKTGAEALLRRLAVNHERFQPPKPWKTVDAGGLAAWLEGHE